MPSVFVLITSPMVTADAGNVAPTSNRGLSKSSLAPGRIRPSMLHKSGSVASAPSSQSVSGVSSIELPQNDVLKGEDYVDGDGLPYENYLGIRVAPRFQAKVPPWPKSGRVPRQSLPAKDILVPDSQLSYSTPPDWDTTTQNAFEFSLQCLGRDFTAISKEVGAPSVSACISYYYDAFKPQIMKVRTSSAYLPSIIPSKPPPKFAVKNLFEFNNDECVVCGDLGDLFMCDSCNLSIHARCATPRIMNQEDPVTCPSCASSYTSAQQAQAREFVISYISVLEARKAQFETMLLHAHLARSRTRPPSATKRPRT